MKLATPHNAHREGAEQAVAAGRHVLVEKPIALTLADADAMIAACESAGVTLMVAESACYRRANEAIRQVLDAGTIGQVLSGRINGIHDMAVARLLLGEPTRIYTRGQRSRARSCSTDRAGAAPVPDSRESLSSRFSRCRATIFSSMVSAATSR